MINNPLVLNKTVRALIIDDERVLLCREQNSKCFFLPGWRVSAAERCEKTLHRNIEKKLSSKIDILKYIGAISSHYQIDKFKTYQEFDLVYLVKLQNKFTRLSADNIEYGWQEIKSFDGNNFSPQLLKAKLTEWFRNGEVFWASA